MGEGEQEGGGVSSMPPGSWSYQIPSVVSKLFMLFGRSGAWCLPSSLMTARLSLVGKADYREQARSRSCLYLSVSLR